MVQSREWSYPGTQGEIVARSWGDPGGAPTFVVLLSHGYGEHIGRYDRVAEVLVAAGAALYAVDHLGHGRSAGERALVSDVEDVVTDLQTLAATARSEWPDLPVVLIGHSMGGLIAARYAQRYAEQLTALVLSGPLIGDWPAAKQLLALEEIPDLPLDISTLSRDPEVGRAYSEDPLVWHGPFKRTTLEALDRAIDAVNSGPTLETLPLLWLHGEQDPLVPIEGSRPGVQHLRGEVFAERAYAGAKHEIFNETNADEVLADLTAWLHGVLARDSQPPGRPR